MKNISLQRAMGVAADSMRTSLSSSHTCVYIQLRQKLGYRCEHFCIRNLRQRTNCYKYESNVICALFLEL